MATAVIVDDEELARRLVREFLKAHGDVEIVAECANGLDAVDRINTLQPDYIFLDVQMPGITGMEVLVETGRRHGVVLTTAYDAYAVRAFELHAVDYLQKPFSQSRFNEALDKLRRNGTAPLAAIESLVAQTCVTRVLIKDKGLTHVVPVDEIEYVRAEDDYIHIHAGGKSWMKTQSLAELEQQLDKTRFVRVHRSYLINIEQLDALQHPSRSTHSARLKNGIDVPVSRSGYERLSVLIKL